MPAQVVQVAVGNTCQPLEAGIPVYLERPLTQLAGGGAGECAMHGVHARQQTDVLYRIAPHKWHGRRAASILDAHTPFCCELLDAARHLRTGQACYRAQVLRKRPAASPVNLM